MMTESILGGALKTVYPLKVTPPPAGNDEMVGRQDLISQLAAMRQTGMEKDNFIKQKRKDFDELTQSMQSMRSLLKEKEELLAKKEDVIENKEELLIMKDRVIEEKEEQLAKKDNIISQLKETMNVAREEVKRQQKLRQRCKHGQLQKQSRNLKIWNQRTVTVDAFGHLSWYGDYSQGILKITHTTQCIAHTMPSCFEVIFTYPKESLLFMADTPESQRSWMKVILSHVKSKTVPAVDIHTNLSPSDKATRTLPHLNKKNNTHTSSHRSEETLAAMLEENGVSSSEWLIDYSSINLYENIGTGATGNVYRASISDSQIVAVKRLHAPLSELKAGQTFFAREASLLCKLHHPHIVRCFGVSVDNSFGLLIITEYMETDLSKVAFDPKNTCDYQLRMSYAAQIASGLAYLHSRGLVHRDIKPKNVLVTGDIVRLCDFGLSTLFAIDRNTMTGDIGTPAYMAPELAGPRSSQASEKIDIYSFGVLCNAIVAGISPYSDTDIVNPFQLMLLVTQGFRPTIPDHCPSGVKKIIQACWHTDPDRRPSAEDIVDFFRHNDISQKNPSRRSVLLSTRDITGTIS